MQNPFQAQAMIHSLNSKRDVLILSFEDINHCLVREYSFSPQ